LLPECNISGRLGPVLLAWEPNSSPTAEDVLEVLYLIASRLEVAIPTKRDIAFTEPFKWPTNLFGLNGKPRSRVVITHVLGHVKAMPYQWGIDVSESTPSDMQVSGISSQESLKALRERTQVATQVILYIRASTLEQTETGGLGFERQFVSLVQTLGSIDYRLRDVSIKVEVCSSSEHPMEDRTLLQSMLEEYRRPTSQQPVILLTTNPDRLTRRSEELDALVLQLRECGIEWWTQGQVGRPAEWHQMSPTSDGNAHDIAIHRQVERGRQLAIQHGYYSLAFAQMIRVLSLDDNSILLGVFRKEISRYSEKFDGVEMVVRTSPVLKSTSGADADAHYSLSRQEAFLCHFIRGLSIPIEVVKMEGISAFSTQAIDRLKQSLRNKHKRLITTALDRLIRRETLLHDLVECSKEQGHAFLSFLWDAGSIHSYHEYCVAFGIGNDKSDPRFLGSLDYQIRVSQGGLCLPIVWPMLWMNNSQDINPICISASQKAQDFCSGFRATSWQGDPKLEIPASLRRLDANERGMSSPRQQCWLDYITAQLKLRPRRAEEPDQVLFQCLQNQAAWVCTCETRSDHQPDCKCTCHFCRAQRATFCTTCRNRSASISYTRCACPALCVCRCITCHKSPKEEAVEPTRDVADTIRYCITDGCLQEAPIGGSGGLRCATCYTITRTKSKQKCICVRNGCNKPQTTKTKWCSNQCYMLWTSNPNTCTKEGCSTVVVPGHGKLCEKHVRRS
jgi:DNA invertase Pin-like site-specific DNA recombinase